MVLSKGISKEGKSRYFELNRDLLVGGKKEERILKMVLELKRRFRVKK